MELMLLVYFADFVENIKFVLVILLVITIVRMAFWEESLQRLWIAITFAVILAVIPSKKTVWLMAGAYAMQSVYESEEFTKIRNLIIKNIEQSLEEPLKGTK